jgi:NADH-quinone oxidoreductase subunit J
MMQLIENILIVIAGLSSVIGAVSLLLARNPLRAALGLLMSLGSVGLIYLILGAHFVGFVQLIIYAGAIIILFLFAIMNFPLGRPRRDRVPSTRLIGGIAILILVGLLISNLFMIAGTGVFSIPVAPRHFDDALFLGRKLVYEWAYPFELVGVLLLIAVIASIHLTRGMKSGSADEEDSRE